MKFYAHTSDHDDPATWEPLFTPDCPTLTGGHCPACARLDRQHGHLNKVAHLAAKFAAEMFPPGPDRESARSWGHLAGLWHDLGKFAPEWQTYLKAKADPHQADSSGTVDHSTAGAQFASNYLPHLGLLLSFVIAGHHAGLTDGVAASDASLESRLAKRIPEFLPLVPEGIFPPTTSPPNLPVATPVGHSLGFFIRLLFSTLVDADFLATESFMSPEQSRAREPSPHPISLLEQTLDKYLQTLARKAPDTPVNRIRAEILQHCRDAAEASPGLYSLTVPTGGGKTLSSLAFALKHARIHDLQRVIYVIPYTSIIEQNAAVFRRAMAELGPDVVIEHHSNLDPDSPHATVTSRLSAENWNARIIVTTNVQFFESLQANQTSRCRKLHRMARSVIILDEAQSLPLEFLAPCLRAIEELTTHYGTTAVLCTATQPAITRHDDFPIGLISPREIIPNSVELYQNLQRVRATVIPGTTTDADLIKHLTRHRQILCIVNTRRHARQLFDQLPDDESRFHLSALMCPAHRAAVLVTIKQRLEDNLPIRLVSTQLIEAGVDIDFPIVFRALAGLDSIAQAAGRCDREGRRTAAQGTPAGQLFVFEPDTTAPPLFIRTCANSAAQTLATQPADILGLNAIQDYFRRHYWDNRTATDQKHILDCYPHQVRQPSDLLGFQFKQCADSFRLIDDYSDPVIVPYGERGREFCRQLRETFDPVELRLLARKLQRYTVAIPQAQHAHLRASGILQSLHDDRFFVLNSTPHYSPTYGLHPEPDLTLNPEQSIV